MQICARPLSKINPDIAGAGKNRQRAARSRADPETAASCASTTAIAAMLTIFAEFRVTPSARGQTDASLLARNRTRGQGRIHPMTSRFPTTRWTLVLAAGDPHRKEARSALASLWQNYWYP